MEERTFIIIALLWALIGLFILLLLANFSQPPQVQMFELEDKVGKIVSVTAEVETVDYGKEAAFLKLRDDSGNITAVYFDSPKLEIISGDVVAVKGKVQLYKGDLEIVIGELRCLSCQ